MDNQTLPSEQNAPAVVKFDGRKCSERIYARDYWDTKGHDCGRPAKMQHDGKYYCGMHDPVKRNAEQKARDDARRREFEAELKRRRIRNAAPDMLAAMQALVASTDYCDDDRPLMQAIRAAIAKAAT